MHYLHRNLHIVHRDLKPANIFLVQNGERIQIKIGDFGVSLNEVNLYEKSEFDVGTLRYMVNIFLTLINITKNNLFFEKKF
jgi:serine/threonine protein kinase